MSKRPPRVAPAREPSFEFGTWLASRNLDARPIKRRSGGIIFAQGDAAHTVYYIQSGGVRMRVLSHGGKEAIIATLGPGDFLGEGTLAGQTVRMATAVAVGTTVLLAFDTSDLAALLHEEHALLDRFLAYVLARNIRVEADLVDQMFNSSEKRLARALLLLARFGKHEAPHHVLPNLSQEMLAEMVGTTRSRVNFFMNKFRRLGLIDYNGGLKVNDALLGIVLHD